MDQKLIDRINELAKKAKGQGLTDAENQERQKLREIYLIQFRAQFHNVMENVMIEDENGNPVPVKIKGINENE